MSGSKTYPNRAFASKTYDRPARCSECDGPIMAGDIIVQDEQDGPWHHDDCDAAVFVTRCPDCGHPWPVHRQEPCPGCGLPVSDLEAAADFMFHAEEER